jgi:putative oxidoreductase
MKNLSAGIDKDYAPLILRMMISAVIFPHGAQKMLGLFGGYGITGTMKYFTGVVHLPFFLGVLVILIEFFAPLALLVGFATRFWSFALMILMVGIIITVHHSYFFMNWFGNQKIEGFEYFLLVIGMSFSLVITGAGSFSLDNMIHRKQRNISPIPAL